jgi:glutathione S-transferase
VPDGRKPRIDEQVTEAMMRMASEARTIERRLAQGDWVVGDHYSAADMVIYPDIRLLLRTLERPAARELATRFLPLEINYPALGRWIKRVESLPGHARTMPPHWSA